jgi:hypothetical protein
VGNTLQHSTAATSTIIFILIIDDLIVASFEINFDSRERARLALAPGKEITTLAPVKRRFGALSRLKDAGILPPPFSHACVIRLRRTMSWQAQEFDFLLSLSVSLWPGFLSHRADDFF